MERRTMTTRFNAISGVVFILGIWQLISPWVLGYSDVVGAALNAVIVGVLIAIFALGRFAGAYYAAWLSWLNVACGIWLIVSPWIVGYSFVGRATIDSVVVGVVVAVLAGVNAATVHQQAA